MVVVDWGFSNLVIPIGLAVVAIFGIRYAIKNWSTSWTIGAVALGAAAGAWLMSWGTWWSHVWVYLFFDNFFRSVLLVIPLLGIGFAVLIKKNSTVREWVNDLVNA